MSAGKVFGIIGIVLAVILLLAATGLGVLYGVARSNSSIDAEKDAGLLDVITLGGKEADSIQGTYSSTEEVGIYLTHSQDTTAFLTNEFMHDPQVNGTGGDFDIEADGTVCYLMIVSTAEGNHVKYDVEFISSTTTNFCLIPAIVCGVLGLLIIIGSIKLIRGSRESQKAEAGSLAQPQAVAPADDGPGTG